MASIASMAVQLLLDGAKFKTGLDGAARDAEQWKKKVSSILSFASSVGLPSLGLGSIVLGFKRMIDELENVGDQAARSGIPVESFMRIIGNLDSEDTALAIMAMGKLRKSLLEVSMGNKETKEGFKKSGLDAAALQYQSIDKSVQDVAKAYVEARSETEKMAIATAAFKKVGVEVIPVLEKLASLKGGGGKFAGLTEEDVAIAEKAHQAWTKVWNIIQSIGNKAVVKEVGELEAVGGGILKMGGRLGEALKQGRYSQGVAEEVARVTLNQLGYDVDDKKGEARLEKQRRFGEKRFKEHKERQAVEEAMKKEQEKKRFEALGPLDDFSKDLDQLDLSLKRQTQTMGMGEAEIAVWTKRWEAAQKGIHPEVIEGMTSATLESAKAFDKLAEATKRVNERMAEMGREAQQVRDSSLSPLEKFAKEREKILELGQAGELVPREQDRAIAKAALEHTEEMRNKMKDAFSTLAPTMRQGSAEEVSFRSRVQQETFARKEMDKPETVIDAMKLMKEAEDRQTKKLAEIADLLRGRGESAKIIALSIAQ